MRLIDVDALKNEIDSWGCNDYDKYDFLEAIDNAPIVPLPDFKEGYKQAIIDGKTNFSRPQGKWIDTGFMEEYWAEEYQCSICGAKDHWHHYCPNCGAYLGESKDTDYEQN